MDDRYKKIYDDLSSKDRAAFRAALASGDRVTINSYLAAAGLPKNLLDIPDKKPGRGRPQVLPHEHCDVLVHDKHKQFTATKSAAGRRDDLSPEDFARLYDDIITQVCDDFYNNHPDIVKKVPVLWFNSLLLELKKQLPTIDIHDAQRVSVAWEAFTGLMYKIGLFPTMESFTCLTGIYRQSLNNMLTPEHIALKEKIFNDCRENMVAQVAYNPMTQVNKLFLLKSVYGFREDQAQQQQTTENKTKNINDIPLFSREDKQDQQ